MRIYEMTMIMCTSSESKLRKTNFQQKGCPMYTFHANYLLLLFRICNYSLSNMKVHLISICTIIPAVVHVKLRYSDWFQPIFDLLYLSSNASIIQYVFTKRCFHSGSHFVVGVYKTYYCVDWIDFGYECCPFSTNRCCTSANDGLVQMNMVCR